MQIPWNIANAVDMMTLCFTIGAQALLLLLEVVEQAESALEMDGGDEDEDDDAEADADSAGESDEEEDKEEDEESEDEESEDDTENEESDESDKEADPEPLIDEVTRQKMYETLGTGPEGSDSESDSDGEDWDDEAMMKLDEALGAHFRMASSASRKQQAKLDFQARRDFKMRVIDLIETFIKRQSSSPLIVELVVPFLIGIRDATLESQPGSKPLAQRLSGVYSNRLCKVKQYAKLDTLPADRCHEVLKDCFELIGGEAPKIAELASSGAFLVVKMLMGGATELSEGTCILGDI